MVRGLTKYITERENLFMEDYVLLHDSKLIIDGDSISVCIYKYLKNDNICFGGDYDTYADAIVKFFDMLSECKVIPHVLFDGATDPNKLDEALQRIQYRIDTSLQINCYNQKASVEGAHLYPLFLPEILKDILKKRAVNVIVCDFDCDEEVARIAKHLNCPALSSDSDYYIHDVKYIPFFVQEHKQNLHVVEEKDPKSDEIKKFLKCKIFSRSKFLRTTRLSQEKLPILSVYLGNDMIGRVEDVPKFCRYLNLKRGSFVEKVMFWLSSKSTQEAIQKLSHFYENVQNTKSNFRDLIEKSIQEYQYKKSKYLVYLDDKFQDNENKFEFSDDFTKDLPEVFVDKYRRGYYHHHFLDISAFHKYYPKPLIENVSKRNAHCKSFSILSIIHAILTDNCKENFFFYGRQETKLSKQIIPKYEKDLPSYSELQTMSSTDRKDIFLEILNVEKNFNQNCIELFPKSWQILLITIKYTSIEEGPKWPFIYSLILSKIIISSIDQKVGRIRSITDLNERIANLEEPSSKCEQKETFNVPKFVEEISQTDCYAALQELMPYFNLSYETEKNELAFDINLVHVMSEFQSCLLHINFLNDLFNMPFEKAFIEDCYNGTLIYNLFRKVHHRKVDFIFNLLQKSPSVLNYFKSVIDKLEKEM